MIEIPYIFSLRAFVKFFLGLFALLFCFQVNAQTVKGKITDEQTGEALPFANVFISNTTLGSTTDIDGNFEITGQIPQTFELAASFVGYYTKYRNVALGGRTEVTVHFQLEPRIGQLDEIQLKARRDKKWERNLKRFERVFLAVADDPFLKDNKILNPWVLDFDQGREGGMKYFVAAAQEPLQIENKALGYHVEYHLQSFVETRRGFQYYGLVNFQELEDEHEIEDLRNSTFQGSLRHFIRSLVGNKIDTLEFEMYKVIPDRFGVHRTNDFYEELRESIVRVQRDSLYICELENGMIRVDLPYKLELHNLKMPWPNDYYENVYHSISWLEAPNGYFEVDESGIMKDPTQLQRSGFIGRERIARFLPHDFEPTKDVGRLAATFDSTLLEINKWNSLRERPHLSLNKSFFSPGEGVWFSGHMLYQNPILSDTLSRSLYVDLFDEKQGLILQEKYPIQQGQISGLIEIPESLSAGNYMLRAYTNWSRNYGEDGFFYLPLPVISPDKIAIAEVLEDWDEPESEIEVEVKATFTQGEWNTKAELLINVVEADMDVRGGTFSVSVVDAELSPSIGIHSPVSKSLDWLLSPDKSILFDVPKFEIEYGVSVSGYFSDRPNRPLAVPITLVIGELEDYGIVQADSSGYFWATGLVFSDSARISVAALNPRRRSFGQIRLEERERPEVSGVFSPLAYQTRANPYLDAQYKFADLMEGKFFELEEVTVANTILGDAASNNYGYGTPDRTIGEDQLAKRPDLTLDAIISMNMPGGMGRYNWGIDAGEPLLMVDGVRFFPSDMNEVRVYLQSLQATEVKSIKLYTFSAGVFGMQGFAGAILVETINGSRKSNTPMVFDDSQFQSFQVRGFSKVLDFPVFNDYEGVIPHRSAVYWNPKLEWDPSRTSIPIHFEMSRQTKRVLVKVEGLSQDKEPVSKIFEIYLNE
jgi:hypothetical protein